MTGITVEVLDESVIAALKRLRARAQDMLPAMEEIGAAVRTHIDLNFRAESDPHGKPWEPLSAVTTRRRGSSAKILRDDVILANSITYQANKESVEIGTSVIYSGTHQFGAKKGQYGRTKRGAPIPWGDIPARPFMPSSKLPDDLSDEIIDIVERHIAKAL